MLTLADDIKISSRQLKQLHKNVEKAAQAVNLIYVHDQQPGITRVKKGKDFLYFLFDEQITDDNQLERIRRLVIPPAWESVWICQWENGHLQATGVDVRQRKQYKYHAHWNLLRNHTKFFRLEHFGNTIAKMREKLMEDIARPGLPPEKVLAVVVLLMQETGIRIGNSAYEKLYGSFGLTTLKDKHVKIQGNQVQLRFVGKKGIAHSIHLRSKRLARIIQKCRDIPGQELFQYYDESGNHKPIDSGMVNDYIKSISGEDFTAKDFRTWAGTLTALAEFKKRGSSTTAADTKKNVLSVLDQVAARLGNTRSVCKKYYVHPLLIELYEANRLEKYIQDLGGLEPQELLAEEEQLLIKILEKGK